MEVRKAEQRGRQLLERLNIPENLPHLPAATFSEGEQQRINLARGFAAPWPILLLDEPTASLDPGTRYIAMDLIREAVQAGTCVIAVFLTPPRTRRKFPAGSLTCPEPHDYRVLSLKPVGFA
ncbi:MAG: ATP-binding cassette domain-containing protein [Desulfobacula sp.]|nr:ATP-binding cassette domain-containing protein [Desulfobacula sp.]